MAIKIIDGFDLYNGVGFNNGIQSKWAFTGGGVITGNVSLVAGRFGGQALRCIYQNSGAFGQVSRVLATGVASLGPQFAFRCLNLGTINDGAVTANVVSLLNTGTYTLGIKVSSNGALLVYRLTTGGAGTLLGQTPNGVISVNTWHFLEMPITINDTTGSVVIKVDSVTQLTLSNVDTNNGVTTADSVRLGIAGNNAVSGGPYEFDDFSVTDTNSTLGERRVETLYVNGDTAQKDWTPSTGTTNYTLLDETLADGADYVSSSTINQLDLYTLGDLSSTPNSIDAVQLTAFAYKTDATARSIALVADLLGTQSISADLALAASVQKYDVILPTKPGGGTWAAADVNNLKIGPKLTV